jgi:uncharacterized SAM-binding protein YcdF (DUF218 family)
VRLLRTGRRLVVLTLLAVTVLVLYVGVTFFQVWRASRWDQARAVDAIIVLGAAQYDGEPSGALQGRLDHALELWDEGLAQVIVPTGGGLPGDRTTEGLTGYTYLRQHGVEEASILVEVDASNTYEALSAAQVILAQRGMSTAMLVSDPYHDYRLLAIAEEVGLDAVVSPAPSHLDLEALGRETAAVALGRLIGFRRLSSL